MVEQVHPSPRKHVSSPRPKPGQVDSRNGSALANGDVIKKEKNGREGEEYKRGEAREGIGDGTV